MLGIPKTILQDVVKGYPKEYLWESCAANTVATNPPPTKASAGKQLCKCKDCGHRFYDNSNFAKRRFDKSNIVTVPNL